MFEEISRQRRARERRQQLEKDIQYRQNLRAVKAEKQRIQSLVEDYSNKAVTAEREGHHDRAVRLAQEAGRLKKYLDSSGGISASLESAHAVATANRALTNIMVASGGLLETTSGMADPVALGRAQASMLSVNENMQMMLEQSDQLMENLSENSDHPDEVGEAFLQQILRSNEQQKHSRLIKDTNRQLDRLQRARAAEK